MRGEHRNVLGALAERGNVKGNHVQAVEQIFAECVASDFLFEFLVGGGDDAHIHRHRLIRSQRLDALFFEDAQHFRLRLQAHVANFVQKKRAAVGFLKLAHLIFARAGEAAFAMAEHFRFDQLLGNGRAVHFHKWHAAARLLFMERASDQLLSGAAFTVNQHAPRGRRGERDLLAERFHRDAAA